MIPNGYSLDIHPISYYSMGIMVCKYRLFENQNKFLCLLGVIEIF
jgi:hypothetical protein